ncbi:SpoIIE family protein phosphatase [Rubritalea marina]|uniref:SpoIIE family protein phosphatase n=1 Tax=Rubritalea marina TaxID=361055 RepID=UPI00036FC7EC|nr:SpoIIE family protein phosphatase [Rubritalea marina]
MDPKFQQNIDAILDASNEGIWDWSLASDSIYFSTSIHTFLGRIPGSDLENFFRKPDGVIHPKDLVSFRRTLQQALDDPTAECFAIDCRAMRIDASVCWLRIRAVIVRELGRVQRLVGTMIDISERCNHEQSLKRERSMLEMVVNNVPVLMYFKDRYSRYRIVNDKMVEWLGCSSMEDVVGHTDAQFYSAETAASIHRDELRVIESGEPIPEKIRHEHWKNKPDSFVKEVKYPWLDRDGEVIGTFGAATDVTRLRLLQSKLENVAIDLQSKVQSYREELAMARELQQAILPVNDGYWQERVDCLSQHARIDSSYQSALELAGDYYDLLPLSDGKLGVFICDVSGIGVRSAFIVSMIRGLIEKAMKVADEPTLFLHSLNAGMINLLGETMGKLPTAACYTVMDFNTAIATVAVAGDMEPLVFTPECDAVLELSEGDFEPSMELGVDRDALFKSHSIALSEAGMFLFSTDGARNSKNPQGESLGLARLAALAMQAADAERPCRELAQAICQWTEQDDFEDDVCLISVRSAD